MTESTESTKARLRQLIAAGVSHIPGDPAWITPTPVCPGCGSAPRVYDRGRIMEIHRTGCEGWALEAGGWVQT